MPSHARHLAVNQYFMICPHNVVLLDDKRNCCRLRRYQWLLQHLWCQRDLFWQRSHSSVSRVWVPRNTSYLYITGFLQFHRTRYTPYAVPTLRSVDSMNIPSNSLGCYRRSNLYSVLRWNTSTSPKGRNSVFQLVPFRRSQDANPSQGAPR